MPYKETVMFVHEMGNKMITHTLKQCVFLNDPLDITQGDTSNTAELTLQPINIIRYTDIMLYKLNAV